MKNAARLLPVYSADTAGVCSVLYELGGMVIVHDASGCNSTYSTHDELRWYDKESHIFISGLSEIDAVFGDEEKFLDDVERAAKELRPRFLALCGSAMAMLLATDMDALARELEARLSLPVFAVKTNAIGSYTEGASEALTLLLQRFCRSRQEGPANSIAVLGCTPLDFGCTGAPAQIGAWLKAKGFQPCSSLSLDCSWQDVEAVTSARASLVVSELGLGPARWLEQEFGIPYVVGLPYGLHADWLRDALRASLADSVSRIPCRQHRESEFLIIGEAVSASSLAMFVGGTVLAPVSSRPELLGEQDCCVEDEALIQARLATASACIADPLYQRIAPPACAFYAFPHIAFSGRCFAHTLPQLIGCNPLEVLHASRT